MIEHVAACSHCGGPLKHNLLDYPCHKQGLCFECHFWLEKVPFANDPSSVRINGGHYFIRPDHEGGFRGFGGAQFTINFFDGRKVVTRNLWSQGTIPESFRSLLPDNATSPNFVEEPLDD